ncbi:MAG: hypothetical protein NTW48_09615 [Chloroflexi bacterium]|nr:hypothetical protein [Chloroflexota bacterium]
MTGKSASILALATLAVAAMLLGSLAGCECSYSSASLSEATMCKNIDEQNRPIERADVFPPDFDIIYCSAKLSNAPSNTNTEVKAQWFDNNNQQVFEKTVTTEEGGTGYIYFSLARTATAASWPTGNYAVKLFLDGKEQVTVPFKIQAGTK